jgi:hypothetical protein
MTIIIAETAVEIAERLGWAIQGPHGVQWTRANGPDVYILVDVLADRLRDEPPTAAHYPDWACGLTLAHLVTLLEVSWHNTANGVVVAPAKSHTGAHTDG